MFDVGRQPPHFRKMGRQESKNVDIEADAEHPAEDGENRQNPENAAPEKALVAGVRSWGGQRHSAGKKGLNSLAESHIQ